jgi:hypothetical protein
MGYILRSCIASLNTVGSSAQLVFGIFVTSVYIKLYGYFQPYAENEVDLLQELNQYFIFLTLFIILLSKTSKAASSRCDKNRNNILCLLTFRCWRHYYRLRNFINRKIKHNVTHLRRFKRITQRQFCTSIPLSLL